MSMKPSLLSYDNYQFFTGSDGPDYFKNLDESVRPHSRREYHF